MSCPQHGVSFALYLLATRGAQPQDLDAALVAVGLVTALADAIVLLWLGVPLAASLRDTTLALLHGGGILAMGLVLFARGSHKVPGVTLARDGSRAHLDLSGLQRDDHSVGGCRRALIRVAVILHALSDARPTAKRA
jgi:hypothetical protein